MQRKFLFAALLFVSLLALGQNPRVSPSSQGKDQLAQERLEKRRQNFTTGRQLLLDRHVPFDPDEVLHEGWTENLKKALDSMPEMHEARHETAPLKGAYMADTLYLPEEVKLSGHTVIIANYVAFEGKNPVIRGNYDLHFFPTKPVVVLETTLSQLLHQHSSLLNVKFGDPLPSFSTVQQIVPARGHVITVDTSGPEPQARTHPPRKPNAGVHTASWNGILAVSPLQADCNTGCNHSGPPGASGPSGAPGAPGQNGISPPNSPNGNCTSPATGSNDGITGGDAQDGGPGVNGGNGQAANRGGDAGAINGMVADNDFNQYRFIANGGGGGLGGDGGNGGLGGNGGHGSNGGNGVACGCELGKGGPAGTAGTGGDGGNGGNGGNGGDGGNGGTITVSLPFNSPGANTSNLGGPGGMGGGGGGGNTSGLGGFAGKPGTGASACGEKAPDGFAFVNGSNGRAGLPGEPGANGQPGTAGPAATVTQRPDPNSGSGSGGGSNQCSGGAELDPSGCPNSPIIIDTEGEGFHLTSALAGVMFDISGTGHPIQIAWTAPGSKNAFLVLDRDGSGVITSGKELFGNFTAQPPSNHPNGFLALAEFDKPEKGGNGDGIIDDKDAVFPQLRLWIDENHDGVCQANELHRLTELGVYSLALNYVESRRTDGFGNAFRYKARVNPGERRDPRDQTPSGDPSRWTYDVFFVTK